MDNEKRGRGRPKKVLTPEEIALRKEKRRAYEREWRKENPDKVKYKNRNAYESYKKYKEKYKERYREKINNRNKNFYFPKIYLKKENKDILRNLCQENDISLAEMLIKAVENTYGVKLEK